MIRLQPLNMPKDRDSQWVSGDVHVHMNYGGAYRNTPNHLVAQAAAENLSDRRKSHRQQRTAHS